VELSLRTSIHLHGVVLGHKERFMFTSYVKAVDGFVTEICNINVSVAGKLFSSAIIAVISPT
jgi:hypothetical protein